MSSARSEIIGAWLKPAIAFIVFLAIWQWGAPKAGIPAYVLPLPTEIAERFWETRWAQLQGIAFTGLTTLIGLAVALAFGIVLALGVVYSKTLRAIVLPALAAFNSVPKIAIAPLLVIWFGLGLESKVVMAFLLAMFPIFVNSVSGLGEIEPDIVDLSRLSGGNTWRVFFKVRLPHAAPYIADAVKIAFPLALVGAIVGEFIGGNSGSGYLVLSAQLTIDTPLVFATLFTITIFATIGIGAIALFERLALSWRPSTRRR